MEQINQAVRKMTERIAAILDGKVHSIWLYGSVVLDDFRPGWSAAAGDAGSGAGESVLPGF